MKNYQDFVWGHLHADTLVQTCHKCVHLFKTITCGQEAKWVPKLYSRLPNQLSDTSKIILKSMASNCSPLVPHLLRGDSQMERQLNMPLPCAQKQWAHFVHLLACNRCISKSTALVSWVQNPLTLQVGLHVYSSIAEEAMEAMPLHLGKDTRARTCQGIRSIFLSLPRSLLYMSGFGLVSKIASQSPNLDLSQSLAISHDSRCLPAAAWASAKRENSPGSDLIWQMQAGHVQHSSTWQSVLNEFIRTHYILYMHYRYYRMNRQKQLEFMCAEPLRTASIKALPAKYLYIYIYIWIWIHHI